MRIRKTSSFKLKIFPTLILLLDEELSFISLKLNLKEALGVKKDFEFALFLNNG